MLLSEALSASNQVEGWLTTNEQTLLYELAREVPEGKSIVELGVWKGKATIMLAAGSMAGSKAPVYAVDYFTLTGNSKHDYKAFMKEGHEDYLSCFLRNIDEARLSSIVIPVMNSTTKAAEMWAGPPPHLIFIDADHRYQAIQSDFFAWLIHCNQGTRIAFHDFNTPDCAGVGSFVNRLVLSRIISHGRLVDSIKYGEITITDRADVERCLAYCPYVVAWILNCLQRCGRPINRRLKQLFRRRTWTWN